MNSRLLLCIYACILISNGAFGTMVTSSTESIYNKGFNEASHNNVGGATHIIKVSESDETIKTFIAPVTIFFMIMASSLTTFMCISCCRTTNRKSKSGIVLMDTDRRPGSLSVANIENSGEESTSELPLIDIKDVEIHKEIGSNDVTTTHKATYKHEQIVIKFSFSMKKQAQRDTFKVECQHLLAVETHINVAEMIGFCFKGYKPALMWKFYRRGSFRAVYTSLKRKFSNAELTGLLSAVTEGLQYLHSNGIIHGRLKCNNILVGNDNKPKLTDYGVRSFDGTCPIQEIPWMAPEAIVGDYNRASDVWSLGVMLWELLYCTLPHEGEDMMQLKEDIKTGGKTPDISGATFALEWMKLLHLCWQYQRNGRPTCKLVKQYLEQNFKEEQNDQSDRMLRTHSTTNECTVSEPFVSAGTDAIIDDDVM